MFELFELLYDHTKGLWELEGRLETRSDLVVLAWRALGSRPWRGKRGKVEWVNGEIENITSLADLRKVLGDELYFVDARWPGRFGEEGVALVVPRSRLAALTGRQADADQPFAAIARLAAERRGRQAER